MSLAGRRPDVLLTPITDNIRLNATIMAVKIRKFASYVYKIIIRWKI